MVANHLLYLTHFLKYDIFLVIVFPELDVAVIIVPFTSLTLMASCSTCCLVSYCCLGNTSIGVDNLHFALS